MIIELNKHDKRELSKLEIKKRYLHLYISDCCLFVAAI